ncbi:uncharacterized protein N7496_000656 [Penicillium cataractarum]|uniref:Uncharacterized protein n=1 Tax=Penicillium cataractarum TaxID=2100454 RepID=A0A9W9VUL8_9EURO|nr:uncharacterized protein N7496_000656 [Penicillium cataractarum]KAJ5389588.1 hypothetical protein N7496_000656 [Penicillium cataractarum]
MPPSKTTPASRYGEHMLGMTPSEIRILLFAHLCFDKDSGKVDFEKLAARADITIASAKTMYRGSLQKLARKNPEPAPGNGDGDDAGPSSGASPAAAAPARRRRGRPRKSQASDAETAQPQATVAMDAGAQTATTQASVPQTTAAPTTGAHAMVNPATVFGCLPGMQFEDEGFELAEDEM